MDKLERFERILNIVEKVRKLDFVAIEAMERLNKQNIDFYSFYTKMNTDKNPKEMKPEEQTQKKEHVMEPKQEYTEDTLKALVHALSQLSKMKTDITTTIEQTQTPPVSNSPIPPDEDPVPAPIPTPVPVPAPTPVPTPVPVQPSKDLLFLDKIKGISCTISDRIKAQTDMLKHAQETFTQTHRMSFTLWKEIDEYLSKNKLDKPVQ